MVEVRILKDKKEVREAAFMALFGTPFERTENGFVVTGRDEKKLGQSIAKLIHYELAGSDMKERENKFEILLNGEPVIEVVY